MDPWISLAGVIGTFAGSGLISLLLLRNKRKESDASVAKGLAEAKKIGADAEAVQVASTIALNKELREDNAELRRELDDVKAELADVRQQLSESAGREWWCLHHQKVLRQALIRAGIDVPELLDVPLPPGDPPKRRRSDYITDEGELQ